MKTYIYPENLRESVERPAFCGDRLLCVSLSSGRRNCNYRLYF